LWEMSRSLAVSPAASSLVFGPALTPLGRMHFFHVWPKDWLISIHLLSRSKDRWDGSKEFQSIKSRDLVFFLKELEDFSIVTHWFINSFISLAQWATDYVLGMEMEKWWDFRVFVIRKQLMTVWVSLAVLNTLLGYRSA
jgi:hypothetical protein